MNDLQLTADVDLQAAADKPARVTILAYSGALVPSAAGMGPVVIESAGLQIPESVTLLSDHNSDRDGVIGSATASVRPDGSIVETGTISRASAAGVEIINLARDGVRWQASVGVTITKTERLREGETAVVNGRVVKAGPTGLTIVRAGVLRETSITALGADAGTSVDIAARKEFRMSTETTLTVDAEGVRLARLNAAFTSSAWTGVETEAEELRLSAIADGRDVVAIKGDIARLRDLQAHRNALPKTGGKSGRSTAGVKSAEHLQASLMLRAGREDVAIKVFGEHVVQQAHELRLRSLTQLAEECVRLSAQDVPRDTGEMLKLAFSTTSLPNVLANTMGRTLLSVYSETMSPIERFVTIKSAANFKTQSDIRPSALQNLEAIGPGGELKHGSVAEEDVFTWSVGTFGKMLTITRHDIINDDLSYFDTLPSAMASAAVRTVLDTLWTLVLAGESTNHFHSSNGNLLTTGSALAIGTLATAVKTFRDQRDSQGNNISVVPQCLVVPTDLETTARTLLNSAEIAGAADSATPKGNPVQGIIPQLHVEPRLTNSDKFSGTSSTAYYLFGGPSSGALVLGYLNGKRGPTVESADAEFNVLGTSIRVYHDFGVAWGDPRAALKATGAGGG